MLALFFQQAYKYHYSFQVLCAAASFVSAFKGRGLKKAFTFFTMTIKIKGIYKGFRYITQIFGKAPLCLSFTHLRTLVVLVYASISIL